MEENFLERLRSLDGRAKWQIIITGSIICMIIIFYLWLNYFGVFILNSGQTTASVVPQSSSSSSWDETKAKIGDFSKNFLGTFGNAIQGSKDYTIEPTSGAAVSQ